jgi:competence protein ComEC
LILRLSYGDASFLLTTDLTEKGVKDALATGYIRQATVLQLASNGGEKENPDEWIKAADPQIAVVEAEQGNKSAQPASTVLDRLRAIPIYRTDLQGTIEMATDGKQIWISTGH